MAPYEKLLEVAQRFLKRRATISELRVAVRECEKKIATPAKQTCGGRHGD